MFKMQERGEVKGEKVGTRVKGRCVLILEKAISYPFLLLDFDFPVKGKISQCLGEAAESYHSTYIQIIE